MPASRRPAIAIFVNPHSRANRRDPRLAAEFQTIVGEAGHVLAPRSLGELDAMAAALHQAPPEVIAVHGGDGTLHRTVTALARAWGTDALPPLAVLCGGTMNVVAASLRIRGRPRAVLRTLTEAVRAGRPLATIRRRCLVVGDKLGFVFGNGLMANFLGEYYGKRGYGPWRALWLILRTFLSAMVQGPFARRVFRRFEGKLRVDGIELERTRFVGISAATVREVGLGFKLIHRADDDPDRFGVLAIHAPPLALAADLIAAHDGRGIAPSRAYSAVASKLEVEPLRVAGNEPGEMSYTIDGDLYRGSGTITIAIGPAISFIDVMGQEQGSSARTPTPSNPQLIGASGEHTMRIAR